VLRYLRIRGELPERTDSLFVVDRNDLYLGSVALTRLVTEEPERRVGETVEHEAPRIDPHTPAHEVARLFENRDLVSAAVVSEEGRLLGRITVDDVVDVIREEAEHSVLSMGGLRDSADAFATVLASVRQRTPWLAVSFAAALVTSSVVRSFEDTIQITAILAALMPIVASMGGIAGTQTVTLIIRGLALGQIQASNASWLLFKEMAVGGLNGFACAAAIAVITALWLDQWTIALLVSAAIFVNLVAAALAGVAIPLVLRRFRLDPALGAGVLLTTCTDVVGFATLLGMAAAVLG
jgi:magnesium transporter